MIPVVLGYSVRTVIANDIRLAGSDFQQRDEKHAQIMVHPLAVGLELAACRASAGCIFQFSDSGLNAGYQEHCQIDLFLSSGHSACESDGFFVIWSIKSTAVN